MKIALAVLLIAVFVLAWIVFSMNASLRRQSAHIETLTTARSDTAQHEPLALATAQSKQSKQEELMLQTQCAAAASRFLASRGWKADDASDYTNHFNSRLNKCFVLSSAYLMNDDFRTLELYDAVEGKRYATYIGHNICEVSFTNNLRKGAMDSGSIWYDGDDSRTPADFTFGFRGLRYGGGAGDEDTQKQFLEQIKVFMTQ